MLFNSFSFLIFFPTVTALYFAIPHRYRWLLLLTASCIFYMAFIPYYILVLFVTIVIDYYAGIKIGSAQSAAGKKAFLVISIISTCLVLFIFKYFNFFNTNLGVVADFLNWNYPIGALNIILPIGLSFHTFQSLSYVIEVYRGHQKVERNFGIYSLYVMFYPQLVAGPIERPQNLLHQFYERHHFDYERVATGIKRMLWGFFSKVVIADNLATYVNTVYSSPETHSGLTLAVATLFFAIQIYCDFSGYANIAIGSAQVMGFKLMENFKNPYLSSSISDFWRRWHISLSTWFKDYVYIPLGGNRSGQTRKSFNLITIFLLSGLWHGANWTYVVWGLTHGIYLMVGDIFNKTVNKIGFPFPENLAFAKTFFQKLYVFLLVLVAWVFFRSETLTDAQNIITRAAGDIISLPKTLAIAAIETNAEVLKDIIRPTLIDRGLENILFLWLLALIFLGLELIDYYQGLIPTFDRGRRWIRWAVYAAIVLAVMNLGVTREIPFIYFQF